MIQCALNGSGTRAAHPHVPVTLEQLATDAAACRRAGAGSVHLHPRRPRLWHGDARANWAVVDAGLAAERDVRVGLEDTIVGRDGGAAPDNAEQVRLTRRR